MGTWISGENALLAFFKKIKLWVLVFASLVALFEAGFSYVNHIQLQNIWKSVASLLRNEVNTSNSYQISRTLSDMEHEGWIKCVKLIETTNDLRIFYDTTTQSYCGFFANRTEGVLSAISGSTWRMTIAAPENIWLHIVRFITPFFIALGLFFVFQFLEKQKKQQEAIRLRVLLEKDYLLDLTKQTQHDIASPIGALKLVIQRIDVAPEYAELLQSITERIEGIFSHLKASNAETGEFSKNMNLEVLDLAVLVKKIVFEKENEWHLEPGVISVKIDAVDVIANGVELSRLISNLLNNSIEAKRANVPLKIGVDVSLTKGFCTIKVRDNGIGISADIISRIGTKGLSVGKSEGNSGLGLYHATKTARSFGGEFSIESEVDAGTIVSIALKRG